MKHTPGPWEVIQPDKNHPSRAMVAACNGGVDIYNVPLTEETKANARLIAASPDLLAACKDALAGAREKHEASARAADYHNNSDCCAGGNYMSPDPLPPWAGAMQAAIAKAEPTQEAEY